MSRTDNYTTDINDLIIKLNKINPYDKNSGMELENLVIEFKNLIKTKKTVSDKYKNSINYINEQVKNKSFTSFSNIVYSYINRCLNIYTESTGSTKPKINDGNNLKNNLFEDNKNNFWYYSSLYWLNEYAIGINKDFKVSDNSSGCIAFYSDFTLQVLTLCEPQNKRFKAPDTNLMTDIINNFENWKIFITAVDFYVFDIISCQQKKFFATNVPIIRILCKSILRNMLENLKNHIETVVKNKLQLTFLSDNLIRCSNVKIQLTKQEYKMLRDCTGFYCETNKRNVISAIRKKFSDEGFPNIIISVGYGSGKYRIDHDYYVIYNCPEQES